MTNRGTALQPSLRSANRDHAAGVALVKDLLSKRGWTVLYDPIEKAESGSPVSADLEARSPTGEKLLFEFKMGDSTTSLPISAYTQGFRLASSGAPAVIITNMKVGPPIATMLRDAQIPVLQGPVPSDSNVLFERLRV